MRHSIFPKSEDKISKLGYGAMGLAGWFEKVPERAMEQTVLTALEKGVNFIDTARAYGDSERILGQALKKWSGSQPFIASKIASQGPDNTRWGIPQDVQLTFPKGSIRKSAETTLKLLNLEQIDLLQLHMFWATWGTRGYWMDELQALKEEGKTRFIGVSVPDTRHDMALPLIQSGLIDSVQTIFNIFDPTPLDNLIPIAREHQVAVIARCILDEGGLSGFLKEDTVFDELDFRQTFFDKVRRSEYIQHIDALRKYIPDHAQSLVALAIKYATHPKGVTTAITSMHVPEYAAQNIATMDEDPLAEEIFQEIRKHHRWVRNFYTDKYWDREAVGGSIGKKKKS